MGMQGMRPMMGAMPGAPVASGMMVAGGTAPTIMASPSPMMSAPLQQQHSHSTVQSQPNAVQLDPFGAL